MPILVFWLFLIIWIIASVNKGKKVAKKEEYRQAAESKQQTASQPVQRQREPGDQWMDNREKQQELKARLAKKYQRPMGSPTEDILSRAKASVEEEFREGIHPSHVEETKRTDEREKEIQRKIQEKLNEDSVMREKEIPQEEAMKEIEDLMIKGPNTELTFQRDFLAEGMDMLNRMQ